MKDPQLPNELVQAIESELKKKMPRHALAAAAKELSSSYRSQNEHQNTHLIATEAMRLAYLAVRMPATFAAVMAVLEATMQIIPDFAPRTLCDIGAGPGTASFASLRAFPSIEQATLYERDQSLIAIGKRLWEACAQIHANWINMNVANPFTKDSHDLSIISYALGELSEAAADALIQTAWSATNSLLILIEPGTPRGFSYIKRARWQLIQSGAFLVAPCPHHQQCPMEKPDWCHFAARLPRTEAHLLIKEVERGFEDEKFSYVVASKNRVILPYARVLRPPHHHSGHTGVVLCTPEGIKNETISRKQGACYKLIKKAKWGSCLEAKPS